MLTITVYSLLVYSFHNMPILWVSSGKYVLSCIYQSQILKTLMCEPCYIIGSILLGITLQFNFQSLLHCAYRILYSICILCSEIWQYLIWSVVEVISKQEVKNKRFSIINNMRGELCVVVNSCYDILVNRRSMNL